MRVCVHVCVCVCVCVHVRMNVCVDTYMCVHVHVWVGGQKQNPNTCYVHGLKAKIIPIKRKDWFNLAMGRV